MTEGRKAASQQLANVPQPPPVKVAHLFYMSVVQPVLMWILGESHAGTISWYEIALFGKPGLYFSLQMSGNPHSGQRHCTDEHSGLTLHTNMSTFEKC